MTRFDLPISYIATLCAIALVLILWFLYKWSKKFAAPSIYFSDLQDLTPKTHTLRERLNKLPRLLEWLAFALLLTAFIDPHYFIDKKLSPSSLSPGTPTEGIAIYILADESGSMAEEVTALMPDGRWKKVQKEELMKLVTKQFIAGDPKLGLAGRPNDLIGLVSVARRAPIRVPLTLDHDSVLKELAQLHPLMDDADSGTSLGYAVYKTANLIVETKHFAEDLISKGKPAYTIKNTIIVMVTDGFQETNPEDVDNPLRSMDISEAVKYLKQHDIRLYVVNVDPSITTEEYAPQRHLMQRVTQETGGHFYITDSVHSLDAIFKDIDQIEKSKLPPTPQEALLSKEDQPQYYQRVSFYPYLIALGLLSLFCAILLNTTVMRRVP